MKLGRKAIKTDTRTLKLRAYLGAALPPAPTSLDWTHGISEWGMMLNGPDPKNPANIPDGVADCTIAGCAHAIQVCGLNVGYSFTGETIADSIIEKAYSDWDGYVPGQPSTDQGGVELDLLNRWRQSGLGLDGHHLLAFADPDVKNLTEIEQAIALFGGVYIGINVPNFIMAGEGPDPSKVWDVVVDDGGIDGGHCVFVAKYDPETFGFISWGGVYRMTRAFWNKYVDEAHALLLATWIRNNKTPSGFNLDQLQTDLSQIK